MKTMAIISLVIVLMVMTAGCALDMSRITSQSDPASGQTSAATTIPGTTTASEATLAIPAPIAPPDRTPGLLPPTGRENVYWVQVELVPSKPVYLPGEEIQMELVLTNASQGEVDPVIVSSLPPSISFVKTGSFSGPALPPGIIIPSSESGKSGSVKTFPAGNDEKTLAKGEELKYNLTWDQKDKDGNQVSPGWYNYESSLNYRPESSENNVGSGVSKRAFLIQYPQGAMQKTIEVNQSRTITSLPITTLSGETKLVDVVITLKRVELNEMGATFYAEMTSPNNTVSDYNNPEWMGHVPLSSQFVVDGAVKEAWAPSSQFLDNRIEFRWGASADDPNYLDPVPTDAKEITFVIPEIRPDWVGPWEFKIKLN